MDTPTNDTAKKLHIFTYWGLELKLTNDNEYQGSCPLCEHDDSKTKQGHLFVNGEKGLWDCKYCGKQGNVNDFFREIYNKALKETSKANLRELSRFRKIPLPALEEWNIAKYGTKYLLPARDHTGKITDIRIYIKGRKESSCAGGKVQLSNLTQVIDESRAGEIIYIVEGFLNAISLDWLLRRVNKPGIVCSTGGANTFKDEWIEYFRDRDVVIAFDNDDAGYGSIDLVAGKAKGSRKVQSKLVNTTNSIKFLTWPKEFSPGYDPCDFVTDNLDDPYTAYRNFSTYISSIHRDEQSSKQDRMLEKTANPHVTLESIIEEARTVFKLNTVFENGLRLSCATAFSTRLQGENNVWMFLLGPPSSGKTAILKLFEKSRRCLWESTLSSKSLISGFNLGRNNIDPSILARVDNRCLVLKDFTEVLGLPETERNLIFSILRGAYDNRVRRPFGTGTREYRCKFAFLAGVTHEIKGYSTTGLGERFLRYNVFDPTINQEEVQASALESEWLGFESILSLQDKTTLFLENDYDLSIEAIIGRIPQWFRDRIKPLGKLMGTVRSTVSRHDRGYKMGQIRYEPTQNIDPGTRLAIQLERLAISLAIIEEKPQITDDIYGLIKQVALDTMESIQAKLIRILTIDRHDNSKGLSHDNLRNASGLYTNLKEYLDDLLMLDIVQTVNFVGPPCYRISDKVFDLWNRAGL